MNRIVTLVLVGTFLAIPVSHAATEVGGQITIDTHWSDPVYNVTEGVIVTSGVTLSIEPGTVVKFDDGKGLSVDGNLVAQGTPTSMIHFTDIRDDSLGGDSNGDGGTSSPSPGWWTGIYVRNNGNATLEHIEILYGGRYVQYVDEAALHKTGAGMLSLSRSAIRFSARRSIVFRDASGSNLIAASELESTDSYQAIYARDNTGPISLIGNTIDQAATYGIHGQGDNDLLIDGNVIRNSGHSGIFITGAEASAIVSSNFISDAINHGIYLQDTNGNVELSFNTVRDNGWNGMYIVRSTSAILNNTARNNDSRGLYISGAESTPLIARNLIFGNDIGIVCAGSANPMIGGSPENANDIHDNLSVGVQNETDTITVNAQFNWWGHESGPFNSDTNPGGLGNDVSDWVDYGSYLNEPALDRIFGDRWEPTP